MQIPLVTQTYEQTSRVAGETRLINWYVSENPVSSEYQQILLPTPGLKPWLDLSGNEVRGMLIHKSYLFVVMDNKFYRINYDKTYEELGTLSTNSGLVGISDIENYIMIVDGRNGYIWDSQSNEYSLVQDEDFPTGSEYVTGLNQFFIIPVPGTGRFQTSEVADGSEWNPLDFSTAEGRSDKLVQIASHLNYLWLFGENTIEIWTGVEEDFPFAKQQGLFIEYGCKAPRSVATAGSLMLWLGAPIHGDPVVMMAESFKPTIVSSRALNQRLSEYQNVENAVAFTYQQSGHEFYVISFPNNGSTWVYDITTQQWHERDYWTGSKYEHILPQCHAKYLDKHLMGDRNSGNLYEWDVDTFTDNGNHIRRLLKTGNLEVDSRRGSLYNVHIRTETGIGTATGQGQDPKLGLRVSKDYGNTWSTIRYRSPGKIGEYRDRALWTRLGYGRAFTLELTATDPVRWIITGARADIDAGDQ